MTSNELNIVKKYESELRRKFVWLTNIYGLVCFALGILIGVNL